MNEWRGTNDRNGLRKGNSGFTFLTGNSCQSLAISSDSIEIIRTNVKAILMDDLEGFRIKNDPRKFNDLTRLIGDERRRGKVTRRFEINDDEKSRRVLRSSFFHRFDRLLGGH